MIMKPRNYFQLAALTLSMAMTVISSSCARDDNPANVPYDTTGQIINLSEITDANVPRTVEGMRELIVSDGQTLTGTLRVEARLIVADRATVELRNVNINDRGTLEGNHAGLILAGSATLVLAENTYNTVKGLGQNIPSIQMPIGGKLSIEGTGALQLGQDLNSSFGVASDTPVVGAGSGSNPQYSYLINGISYNKTDTFEIGHTRIRTIEFLGPPLIIR